MARLEPFALLVHELFQAFASLVDEFVFEDAIVTAEKGGHLSFPGFAWQRWNNDLQRENSSNEEGQRGRDRAYFTITFEFFT
jgi:hypothetical protein